MVYLPFQITPNDIAVTVTVVYVLIILLQFRFRISLLGKHLYICGRAEIKF